MLSVLQGNRGAQQLVARALDLSTGQDWERAQGFGRDRAAGTEASLCERVTIMRHGGERMVEEAPELTELVLLEPISRPPLRLLELLLQSQEARGG